MKKNAASLLLHPLFLISLCVLFCNDFYLKAAYPGFLTGKLSDIAGLVAFSLFLFAILPINRIKTLFAVALFFIWWKSSLSNSFIFLLNHTFSLPVYRVVDYTDLIALLPLPLLLPIKPWTYKPGLLKQIAIYSIGLFSCFCFMATSMVRHTTKDGRVSVDKYISTKKNKEEIVEVLKEKGFTVRTDSAIYEIFSGRDMYIRSLDTAGNHHMVPIDSLPSYVDFYRKINYGTPITIQCLPIGEDSLQWLQLLVTQSTQKKNSIWIHSYHFSDTTARYFEREAKTRKIKKPLIKQLKKILK